MKQKRRAAISLIMAMVALVVVAGCSEEPLSTREKGTLIGEVLGAATGAIISAAVGAPGAGAALAAQSAASADCGRQCDAEPGKSAKQTQAQINSQQQQIQRQQHGINSLKQQNETGKLEGLIMKPEFCRAYLHLRRFLSRSLFRKPLPEKRNSGRCRNQVGTGAIIRAVGSPAAGQQSGGAIGGVGGYAVGNHLQNQENQQNQTQAQINSQQQQIERQQQQIQQLKQQNETE